MKTDTAVGDWLAYLIFALVLSGVVCLITVLSRILQLGVAPDRTEAYYQATVRLFVLGVGLAVSGVVLDMAGNFLDG